MFKTKTILVIMIFGCITLSSIAEIDIVYPHENMTTDVHYATTTDTGYTNVTSNSIPDMEYTHVIIKNKISDTDDLIDEPQKIFNSLSGIFYMVIFTFVLLLMTYTLKKVLL
jgi:hypothetical protein